MSEIEFRKIGSTELVVSYILRALLRRLDKNENVAWFLSGGSAIKIACAVAEQLKGKASNLRVTLVDERFGPVGFSDSNWQQLTSAGFNLPEAQLIPVLSNSNMDDTVRNFSKVIKDLLHDSDYCLALAGMGADGHILGIKPNSPSVDSEDLAIGYSWDDYKRITMGPAALKELDEVVVYAVGEEKLPQLKMLQKDLPATDQPAQLLKTVSKVTVFNDSIDNKGE